MRFSNTNDPRHFWMNVEPSGCWEWGRARDRDGYGQARTGRKRVKAHRKAYEMVYGPVPLGMSVLHRCDNPPCVRPDHLYAGTQLENETDRILAGHKRGIEKLSAQAVQDIRNRYALGLASESTLASEFGVQQTTISRVVRRLSWKHVP